MIGVIWMIVNLHFNWLPENALNKAYQVWLPDMNINFLDIWIDTMMVAVLVLVMMMLRRMMVTLMKFLGTNLMMMISGGEADGALFEGHY